MLTSKRILVSGLLLAALAGAPVHAAQYARPDADLTTAGWTPVPDNPPNALSKTVDDPFVTTPDEARDTSDYINSGNGNNSTVILGLSDIIDPGVDTGHILRFTCQATVGNKPKGGEGCDGALWEVSAQNPGGLQIASTINNTATRGAFGQVTLAILDTEAVNITDYTALEVRITSSSLDTDESIQVAWIELELPDPAITAPTVTNPTFDNVTHNSATLGGTMDNDNGTPVTDCGVEWGDTVPGNYNLGSESYDAGTCITNGSVFTSDVSGLPSDTTIYFRAWATNGVIGNSDESSFPTDPAPTEPTVTADPVTVFDQNSATMGGEVTSDGGAPPVFERGIVWDTDSPPESGGTFVQMGSGLGTFGPQTVGGLPAGTLIYFKAYAINSVGTGYSGQDSFTTQPGLPTVTSPTKTGITATTATLGGTMTSNGGEAPSACGVKWSTVSGTGDSYPPANTVPLGAACTVDVAFSTLVSDLPTGTVVYYRAYATNSSGTAYSPEDFFTPAGPPEVTTTPVTVFDSESAVMGGDVTSDGGSTVTARGVVWDTVSPPEAGGTFVPIGSGTGVFSQNVTGLPASTPIYVKAYATNSSDTSYGGEETFTTLNLPEPTVQASNVVFSRISGRAFTIDWTRGNGEGSIVVLRLQATGKTEPSDGNDYTPEPDLRNPPTELPVSSGNYVIHKGPQSTVWVTGLALDTTYSVAVYEYTNNGANTDYLLTPPAVGSNEGTQATGTVPTHNEDFRADCAKCHYHGSFNSRGTSLENVCKGCHKLNGEASNKLEFANHLGPSNPDIDHVDCGVCHEVHLGGTTHTLSTKPGETEPQVNKSFVRANVDKYIPNATTPAFLHTDDPGHGQEPPDGALTPDRAIEGGTGGYCQVCHTITEYHRNTVSPEADQCHDGNTGNCGPAETNCGTCHWHSNSFQGVGGSVSCVVCHASQQPDTNPTRPIITTQFDRLSKHVPGGSAAVTQPDCQVCHNFGSHYGQKVNVFNVDDGSTTYEQPTLLKDPLATGEGETFEPHCLSCHGDSIAASLDASGGDQTQTSPFTGSDLTTANVERIDATSWAFAAHNRPSGSFPSSPVTCIGNGANGCHASGHGSESNSLLASWDGISDPNLGTPASSAPVGPIAFCYNCHDADGPSSIDVQSQFNSGTNFQQTSGSGALINQRHDITTADQTYSSTPGFAVSLSCKDCHSVHVDSSATHGAPVIDPDTATPLPNYSPTGSYTDDGYNISYNGGGDWDPLNPEGLPSGGFTEPDYIQFCLTCHDGTTPPGVTLSEDLINMADAYAGSGGEAQDQHGPGDGGTQTSTSGKGGLKFPWVTPADDQANLDPVNNYAAMNCSTCHGAHGTGSIFNLRESITVAGVQMTVGGGPYGTTAGATGILDEPSYFGSSTYTIPVQVPRNGDPTQQDHYWGAWCTFCHKMNNHPGKTEEDSCTNGHMHGGGAF
jgi:hypothetical protein